MRRPKKRIPCVLRALILAVLYCVCLVCTPVSAVLTGGGISGQEWDREQKSTFDITMTFAGDVMIASYKDQLVSGNFKDYASRNPPTYFLQNFSSLFASDDFTVVNLENVLSDRDLTPRYKGSGSYVFWFKSQTANTDILTSSSVEGVSLSNNHTYDYGEAGYQDTIAAVEKAGLNYGTDDRTMYFEKNGFRIAVICTGLWNESQADTIVNRIKGAEPYSDFQIVFFHGGAEGTHTPEQWKIRASRKLVDNGADLVVGNHPHVLQPRENYNGADIIYSMGNFCFGGNRAPENRTILYQLTIHVQDGKMESREGTIIPCYVYTGSRNNYCPEYITVESEKQRVLDFMDWKRSLPY